MQSLVLAAEGMVVCHLKKNYILSAVITLSASYYTFNADYPKGLGGHRKNIYLFIYLFIEYILIPELKRSNHPLPISVEPVVCKLNRMT